MPLDLVWLSSMGLPEILLWLLSFAVFFGVLEKVKFIPNKEINAIISIVVAFLVLLATPIELLAVLSSMSQSLILLVLGVIVLLVFLEVAGIKHYEYSKDKDGNVTPIEVSFFSANPKVTAIGFLIIAILIFVGSGGLELLGWQVDLTSTLSTSMLFFVVVILAILWMITESGKSGKK